MAKWRQTKQKLKQKKMNTPTIGHPTKKSIYLEIEQTKQTINTTRQRTNYTQEYNQNNEVYIHNTLNPQ